LCEKPVAVTVVELQEILEACDKANVQFMDGVMFMHHERLNVLLDKINDPFRIHGKINLVTSGFSIQPSPEWIDGGDIRTRSDGDPLGCIGDLGWYCARIGICVFGYRWPKHLKVIGVMTNRFGIVIDVDVVVSFDDSESEILKFHCSFVHAPRQWVEILGTNRFYISDFVVPRLEDKAIIEIDHYNSGIPYTELTSTSVVMKEKREIFNCRQEQRMIENFSNLVLHKKVDSFWPRITMITQSICSAVLEGTKKLDTKIPIKCLSPWR